MTNQAASEALYGLFLSFSLGIPLVALSALSTLTN